MRKLLFISALCIISVSSYAQATLQDRLYYSCKVWGFVKYYHSNVSTCNVDWDSVLVHVLPAIRTATTDSAFNDALDTMLAAAGPMALSSTPFPDVLPPELKRNRDFSWMSSSIFRSDVHIQLDTIRNNFRPHAICWVRNNTFSTSYQGYLEFPHDSLAINTFTTLPDQDHRLLLIFKHWNVLRYFNPYNYVLDTSWDNTLRHYVVPVANAATAHELTMLYLNIVTALNDAHVYGFSYNRSNPYPAPIDRYAPHIRLNYIGGKYVVIKSAVSGIYAGDAIVSIDGLTTTQWEDSLKQYYSSGNPSVLRRSISSALLRRTSGTNLSLVVEDSSSVNHTFTLPASYIVSDTFFTNYYYPKDTLGSVKWMTFPCGIGYVNMGNLMQADVPAMYADLSTKSAIIFDIRNYPNGTAWNIANLMYASTMPFAKLTIPDVTYPGTYSWTTEVLGTSSAPDPYTGQVIILMNQETQSQAEYSCMILEAMPGVIKVGSQTAGADGNVSYWSMSQDYRAGFTSLGVYYPNGDSTQRIGIVPDSFVYPTRAGIRHHYDEVLAKALSIGGCYVKTPDIAMAEDISVFPNPASEYVSISISSPADEQLDIQLCNMLGEVITQGHYSIAAGSQTIKIDLRDLRVSPGNYYLALQGRDGNRVIRKFAVIR